VSPRSPCRHRNEPRGRVLGHLDFRHSFMSADATLYTMTTTVRIREDDRNTLQALQAKLTLAQGSRLPLEEVLHRALKVAEAHEAELMDAAPALTEEDIAYYLSLAEDRDEEPARTPHGPVSDEDRDIYEESWK
jgi:hypothetical protein